MSPDDIRQQIELQVVELIKEKLEQGLMTESRGQQISTAVLTILSPGMTLEELFKAIPRLDDTFPELSPIVLPYIRNYEERITGQAREKVRELIKEGKFDAAAKLGAQVIKQDIKLKWHGSGSQKQDS